MMGSEPDDSTDLLDFLHSLPEHPTGFTLRKVTFEEVLKEINRLRSDSSTGYDQIPVKYIKLGKDHLAGPLMHIINTCIAALMFPRVWKTARVSLIPKIDQPTDKSDSSTSSSPRTSSSQRSSKSSEAQGPEVAQVA